MTGKIIKGIGGFYYVASGDSVYTLRAKGILRNRNLKPLIGDVVEFTPADSINGEGSLDDILPRRNQLIRPAVSNIDIICAVQACALPAPQFYLLDRYLISAEHQGVDLCVIFNKAELAEEMAPVYAKSYRDAGYPVFVTSAATSEGIDELREFLHGKSAVFAGPSGVGKSSLTNILCPDADMKTNGISRRIERGRHTTRHSEFFVAGEDTFICDTPGFTAVGFESLEEKDLRFYMPDIAAYEGKCRFNGCLHMAEPGCCVTEAVKNGTLSATRYDSYVKIYQELKAERRY